VTETATASMVNAGLEAAATVLADKLGLGDQARRTDSWPIDSGDSVLRMPFDGDPASSMVLAVNDEVAERLLNDSSLLARAFTDAFTAFNTAAGTSFAPGQIERGGPERPGYVAEILDNGNLTSLAGITVPDSGDEPDDEPIAAVYEPAPIEAFGHGGVATAVAPSALSVLHDVELIVTAELGRTTMPVRELLGLTPGMVVEIDRAAGAPIDLLVNGRRIAAGEVVVIDEEFGIRITEIAPTSEQQR
jgi:flagellar motor switch protein FliN